jgi:hypothetical protein
MSAAPRQPISPKRLATVTDGRPSAADSGPGSRSTTSLARRPASAVRAASSGDGSSRQATTTWQRWRSGQRAESDRTSSTRPRLRGFGVDGVVRVAEVESLLEGPTQALAR